ncbi:MAG: hypothetical protein K8Q89_00235 [Nitrosarchaeum sp.]|nr:hypothetical protein [Nitrosarchaeum sp.]
MISNSFVHKSSMIESLDSIHAVLGHPKYHLKHNPNWNSLVWLLENNLPCIDDSQSMPYFGK